MAIEISVYPNPFDYYLVLEITCEDNIDCIILLADVRQGKIIRMLGVGLKSGMNRIPFNDLATLEAGNYQLEIKTADGDPIHRTKVFKQEADGPLIHLN